MRFRDGPKYAYGLTLCLKNLDYRQHSVQSKSSLLRGLFVYGYLVYNYAFVEAIENPRYIGRVNSVHGRAGADD